MKQLIACCGLDCENCDTRLTTVRDDNGLREQTARKWVPFFNTPWGKKTIFCGKDMKCVPPIIKRINRIDLKKIILLFFCIVISFDGFSQTIKKKEMDMKTSHLKKVIKKWITNIDKTEELPSDIVALSFNLYEPYSMELVGSAWFDEEDEDWACDEDFEPVQRRCPDFELPNNLEWQEALEIVATVLKDLIKELPDLKLFKVEHIAVGFVDGDLIIIK